MIEIVEPKESIIKLWGKQQVKENGTYRLMRYVLRVDHDNKVLLHNVVTGQLVVLEQDEADMIERLPATFASVMKPLVTNYYLVPESYDEYQQVINLRTILQKLNDYQRPDAITHYTIFPTTACNARCYYCFEQGVKFVTMTEKTANDVVDFIVKNCGNDKRVRISWFGGEPTVASHRIDQICHGLQVKGIEYKSDITTNGYLFDEEMVSRARDLWHLQRAMICFDGTEKTYNKTKAYVNAQDNPYRRVIRNIGLLLKNKIYINLRMNYDLANYQEFPDFIKYIKQHFSDSSFLQVRAHPVNGEYKDSKGKVMHADEEWFTYMQVKLNNISRSEGYLKTVEKLPGLNINGCQANNNHSATITVQGKLVCCPEQFENNQIIGNLYTGVENDNLVQSWKRITHNKRCKMCLLFPDCMKLERCGANNNCYSYLESLLEYQSVIKRVFDSVVLV